MEYSEIIKKEKFSVAIPAALNFDLTKHLLKKEDAEEVAFALYKPSGGTYRFTALIYKLIFPKENERTIKGGSVEIEPAFFRRVCQEAMKDKAGLALVHSHLTDGWQGMSVNDFKTEISYSTPTFSLTDLPFVGLTLGTDGTWAARQWAFNNEWTANIFAESVRVVGENLTVYHNDILRPPPVFQEMFKRTVTVWGESNHKKLARLRVGIAGLGSVGSIVAEALARMGVQDFVLIDFDEVQTHNLDRLLGASKIDIHHEKVFMIERQILKNATAQNVKVRAVLSGITEKEGYEAALDCDVLFSCVDRPWPRETMNHIAYRHLIPVIDGGISVRFDKVTKTFDGADWQLQTVSPDKPCLRCIGAYEPSDVDTERKGLLEDSSYLAGLPNDHPFKRNENIFPFSLNLASLEVMQLIQLVTDIGTNGQFGVQRFSYNEGYIRHSHDKKCENGCVYAETIATGDQYYNPTGTDHSAIAARARQNQQGEV